MKLKKFKYLLSIGATALAIAPIASLAINVNSNAIVKTNVKNNEDTQEETTDSSSTLITPDQPTSVDPATLSPAGNDLYNDYNYESGYVVKDVANATISFYNWFKQKLWDFKVTDQVSALNGKTLKTMNIRGALNADGSYDTKLFVYGNIGDTTTTGSYVFEIDMTNGAYIENSLVQNTTTTTSDSNGNTVIHDIRQLTVIDENTVVVSGDITNTAAAGSSPSLAHTLWVSIITFNSITNQDQEGETTSAPTVQTTSTNFGGNYNFVFGEVLGVIKKQSEYVFAISTLSNFKYSSSSSSQSVSSSSSFDMSVSYWYFKSSSSDSSLTLTQTGFQETSALTSSYGTTAFALDSEIILDNVSGTEISSMDTTTTSTGAGNIGDVNKAHAWLETKCTNFSVVYPGTPTDPKMLVSFNWDTTDLSANINEVGTNGTGKDKVTLVQFNSDTNASKDQVIFSIYKMPANITTTTTSNQVALLGISNLVYTRTKSGDGFIQPYAVIVGQANADQKPSIWFNLVKLDTTSALSNTSATSGTTTTTTTTNGNDQSVASTGGAFSAKDLYTTDGKAVSGTTTTNINKMDWQLQFIPGNGTKGTSDSISNYYGYITTGIENTDTKSVDFKENFFALPATVTANSTVTELELNGYQFGISDAQLQSTYKAATTSDTSINPNSIASDATKQSIIANLSQVYSYTVTESSPTIPESGQTGAFAQDSAATISNPDTSKLVFNDDGSVTGSISYSVKNWWNDNTTTITKDLTALNLKLSPLSEFNFNLSGNNALDDSNSDPKSVAKWLEAKYSFEKLFPSDAGSQTTASQDLISFLKDLLNNANMGATLKAILINSLSQTSTNTATTTEESSDQGSSDGQGGTTQQSSVKLQADEDSGTSAADAAIKVGQYITVTPNSTDKSVAVGYDLSAANLTTGDTSGADQAGIKGTLNFKDFTGTIDPNSTNYNSYQDWSGESSPADNTPTPGGDSTPQTPTNNNSSSSLSGGAIAGIIIAVLVVIALIIGIYFFVKKRKNIQ